MPVIGFPTESAYRNYGKSDTRTGFASAALALAIALVIASMAPGEGAHYTPRGPKTHVAGSSPATRSPFQLKESNRRAARTLAEEEVRPAETGPGPPYP